MCRRLIYFVSFILMLGSVSQAEDIQWTDLGPDHLWSTPANWDLGRVPTLADDVRIDVPAAAAPNGPVIQDGIDAKANGIFNEAPGEPTLTMTGGILEVAEWIWWGDGADSFGIWDMSGGTVTVANEFELGWDGGAGTLIMTGGTINAGEAVIPTGSGAFGELFLNGGTYNVTKPGGLNVKENGLIDITEGTLVLEGDETAKINELIAAGRITAYDGRGQFELDYDDRNPGKTMLTAVGRVLIVEAGGDIAAANAIAEDGDTIEIAAGTYYLTSQIEIKDGVTYRGAGPGLTIIDGNDVTRAFVAWGDRSFNEGNENPNDSGPKGWVLEGMTIQNCVADTNNRFSFTGAAFTLKTDFATLDADASGGLNPDEADGEVGGIRLAGADATEGTEDDDLHRFVHIDTDGSGEISEAELDAQILVQEDEFGDEDGDGGAITIHNGAVGTIANCDFLNNHTPIAGDGDDGGAIKISGLSTITIEDCWFEGNYACSPTSVAETDETGDADGDGGHIKLEGSSASAVTPGTTLIANHCVFLNGNAEDDGGAIQTAAVGSVVRLDACWFEGNTSWDNGNVLFIGNESSGELTVTNCIFANNITKADNSPDRMCQVRRNSKFINCTFVGNNQEDQDLIYNNAAAADTDNDGVDDEMADTTQVVNCIFANNVVGNGDDVLGSRNNDFTIAATNCLFFGNTLQNGNAADNTQRPDVETGSITDDPLLDAEYVPIAGSPAIDAGVDPATVGVTLTTDYNGDSRPQGAAYDIGAYEIAAVPTNLVQNGGFDDASAWVILEHTVPAVTTIDPAFMDDAPSQGVAPCLRIASADNGESRPIVYQKLTLVAGQEYMVSSAIKILDATPASPSGTWFQIYMSPEEPDPVPEQTIDWNPPYKIFNIDAWGSNIADFIGFDGLFAEGSQSFQVGDGTGLYVPPGEAGSEVDIFLVIKPGQCCRVGSYDVLFDNVSVYAK